MRVLGENRYLREWPAVQNEIAAGPHGQLFRSWIPEWLTRATPPDMEELGSLLDEVWDKSPPRGRDDFARYYRHPVWWLNARMEEVHLPSIRHRLLAVAMAEKYAPKRALDRGGGYGLLIRMAHATLPQTLLELEDLIEQETSLGDFNGPERVRVVPKAAGVYDVIWSVEVFEHLPDPIQEAYELNRLLRTGGALITSFSFFPIIKCHLPRNFYLRHVFHRLLPFLGYRCDGYERPGVTIWAFRKIHGCSRFRLGVVKLLLLLLRPFLRVLNACYPYLCRSPEAGP